MRFRPASVLALVLSCAVAWGAGAPFDTARLDRIFDVLEAKDRLRGSVTLAKDGEILYTRAFGLRDATRKVGAATAMRVGSITKVFTATLIYQLIDEGKLRLDTPLARFFPEIPNAKAITIAHLLAHASGLPNLPSGAEVGDRKSWVYRPQEKRRMIARFAAAKPDFRPGEKVAYSNPGYMLLGYILEAVTHSTYDRQLQKRIARPLDLRRTRFGGAVREDADEAHSYTFDEGHWSEQPECDMTAAGGAGAVVSTSAELTRFIGALFAGRLISPASLDEMQKPFSAGLSGVERKGVVVSTLHRGLEKTICSHLGGIDAFSSNLVYFPDDRLAVGITLNGQDYPMGKLFWLLIDAYYGRPLTPPSFDPVVLL
jgi:D-alanyl-D-alanine carboxypeptidase